MFIIYLVWIYIVFLNLMLSYDLFEVVVFEVLLRQLFFVPQLWEVVSRCQKMKYVFKNMVESGDVLCFQCCTCHDFILFDEGL